MRRLSCCSGLLLRHFVWKVGEVRRGRCAKRVEIRVGSEIEVRAQCSDTGFIEGESCFVDSGVNVMGAG